jgi:hypothetical protein
MLSERRYRRDHESVRGQPGDSSQDHRMTSGTGRGRTFIRRGQRPWDAFGRAASRALVATVGAKYAKQSGKLSSGTNRSL